MKSHFAHILKPSFRTLLFLLAAGMFLFSCEDDIELSSEATITSLTLTVGSTDYEIDFTNRVYTLTLPVGSTLPTRVGVKNIVLSSGATTDAGDQLTVTNNAVTLTVTSADGTTRKTYTVTLVFTTIGIASFTFEVPGNENMALDTADRKRIVGIINQQDSTITFARQSAYVYRDKLKATFEVSEEGAAVQVADVDQTSGTTEQDFRSPVAYVVRAQDGTEIITYRVTLAKSTLATIPDDQFRAKLKDFVPDAFTEDQLNITHDDVVNSGALAVNEQTPKLTSLKGIEFFTALTTLDCSINNLTSLDVSRNTALDTLDCSENSLPSLNVSRNTALESLNCMANHLASLNVSANTALKFLWCGGNHDLTPLDVRANTALTNLNCVGNGLTSLDVRANTALTRLDCSYNALTSLDVSVNTALMGLDCNNNSLTSLDVRANTALTGLQCHYNSLTSLDVRANTALTQLGCYFNDLTSLDVSANTALEFLWCTENSLTSLDMTGVRSVAFFGWLNIGTGTGENNLLETLRVNTVLQDNAVIIAMKTARGTDLTITTVNDAGEEKCANYTPATGGGNCN